MALDILECHFFGVEVTVIGFLLLLKNQIMEFYFYLASRTIMSNTICHEYNGKLNHGGFWLPNEIHKEIKNEQRKFWWGKDSNNFFCGISWDRICKHKHQRGLGICKAATINLALLTKLNLENIIKSRLLGCNSLGCEI